MKAENYRQENPGTRIKVKVKVVLIPRDEYTGGDYPISLERELKGRPLTVESIYFEEYLEGGEFLIKFSELPRNKDGLPFMYRAKFFKVHKNIA